VAGLSEEDFQNSVSRVNKDTRGILMGGERRMEKWTLLDRSDS
jgi:hypothetical protein